MARVLRRPLVADCAVTGVAVLLAVVESTDNPHLGPGAPWSNHLLGVLVALTLLARRRAPEVVVAVCLAAHLLHISPFTLFFAFYAEGAYRGPRRRSVVWCTALVGLAVLSPQSTDAWHDPQQLVTALGALFLMQVLVPVLLGLYVAERRAVLRALVDRAERAEREQALIADAAVAEERRRIAGEMHDVVSHQVSLMVVHANALQQIAGDPARAKEAAGTIATAGSQALNELRDMIGVLRRPPGYEPPAAADSPGSPDSPDVSDTPDVSDASEVSDASATADSARAPAAPQVQNQPQPPDRADAPEEAAESQAHTSSGPSLSRVPDLVAASRAAGLPVELRWAGEPLPSAEATERAAYRVIQEALTNVHKHAPGAPTDVVLTYRSATLRVGVLNSSPSASGPAVGAGTGDGPVPPALPSGGHGLIGLRERVRLAGGGIETGPRPGGGFLVVAELPLASASEPEPRPGSTPTENGVRM